MIEIVLNCQYEDIYRFREQEREENRSSIQSASPKKRNGKSSHVTEQKGNSVEYDKNLLWRNRS
jgi:hypothetical protein